MSVMVLWVLMSNLSVDEVFEQPAPSIKGWVLFIPVGENVVTIHSKRGFF